MPWMIGNENFPSVKSSQKLLFSLYCQNKEQKIYIRLYAVFEVIIIIIAIFMDNYVQEERCKEVSRTHVKHQPMETRPDHNTGNSVPYSLR